MSKMAKTSAIIAPTVNAIVKPLVSVDVALFAVVDDCLHVLLTKRPTTRDEPFPGQWALVGGFVDITKDKTLAACAARKLRDKAEVSARYIEQVGSWGDDRRDPRAWSTTHLYFGLVSQDEYSAMTQSDGNLIEWVPVNEGRVNRRLAFDHTKLLAAAAGRLRSKMEYTSLPAFLAPEVFVLSALQRTFEVVLNRPLNKSAFRNRIDAAGLVRPIGTMTEGRGRPSQLYRLASEDLIYFNRVIGQE